MADELPPKAVDASGPGGSDLPDFNPEDVQPGPLAGSDQNPGGGRGGQPDSSPDQSAPAAGEEPQGGGTVAGDSPQSGTLQSGALDRFGVDATPSDTSTNLSLGTQIPGTSQAPPSFTGNGYGFISPGVTYGTMSPGGHRFETPQYSYFDKGTRSWMPVKSPAAPKASAPPTRAPALPDMSQRPARDPRPGMSPQ